MQVLKGCKKLAMSVCSVGRIPGGYITNHIYTWVDPQGRSVSPPSDLEKQEQHSTLGRQDSQRRGHTQERAEKTVSLILDRWLSYFLNSQQGSNNFSIHQHILLPGKRSCVGREFLVGPWSGCSGQPCRFAITRNQMLTT